MGVLLIQPFRRHRFVGTLTEVLTKKPQIK